MFIWLAAITVVVIDGVTKNLAAEGILKSSVTVNYGLAFSIGSSNTISILITAAITAVLFFYYFKNRDAWNRLQQIAFGLILGGASGNLLDRLYNGRVLDFIRIGNSVLNFADLAIFLGLALIIFEHAYQNKLGRDTRP